MSGALCMVMKRIITFHEIICPQATLYYSNLKHNTAKAACLCSRRFVNHIRTYPPIERIRARP